MFVSWYVKADKWGLMSLYDRSSDIPAHIHQAFEIIERAVNVAQVNKAKQIEKQRKTAAKKRRK